MANRDRERARLDELLDAVRNEFDNLTRETSRYKDDHHEYELKLNQQHQELTNISNTVYELEQAHRSMKEAYEREIMKLKQELEVRDRLLEQQAHSAQLNQQQQQQAQAQAQAQAQQQQVPQQQAQQQAAQQQAAQQAAAQQAAVAQQQQQAAAVAAAQQQQQQHIPPPNLSSSLYNQDAANGDNKIPIAPLNSMFPNGTSKLPPLAGATPAQSTAQPTSQSPVTTQPAVAPAQPAVSTTTTPAQAAPAEVATTAAPSVGGDASSASATNANSPGEKAVANGQQTSPSTETALVKRSQHNKPIPAFLRDFDAYATLPYKKQHTDYYIVYNPNIPKKVDVSLIHSFDHTSVVCCVSFSKDGKFLATGCNKLTQVFSVETGDLVARLNDESSLSNNGNYDTDTGDLYIRSVCFSPDGKFLATGAEDKIIRIWDLATRTIVKYLKGHEQDIYSLDFFPDGKRLVSGSGDRTVRIWDVYNGQCSLTLSIEDGVTTVAVSPDGSLIAAGSLDRTVRVWDANKGYLVERLDSSNEYGNGHMDSVYSVTFTNQGKEIASGSLDRTIKLWSLKGLDKQPSSISKSNCEVTYVGHKDFVLSVCCTPDDQFILSGSKDRGVIMWDKASGEPYIMLQGHRNSVISVSVSPVVGSTGGYFATGSGDCKARIWKWEKVEQ